MSGVLKSLRLAAERVEHEILFLDQAFIFLLEFCELSLEIREFLEGSLELLIRTGEEGIL